MSILGEASSRISTTSSEEKQTSAPLLDARPNAFGYGQGRPA